MVSFFRRLEEPAPNQLISATTWMILRSTAVMQIISCVRTLSLMLHPLSASLIVRKNAKEGNVVKMDVVNFVAFVVLELVASMDFALPVW